MTLHRPVGHRTILALYLSAAAAHLAETAQPLTKLFEHVDAEILLARLDAMEGGFGNAQPPREIPVGRVASSSDFAC